NTMLLKHASNVTGCALALERLFGDLGFPTGVFQTMVLSGRAVAPIIRDDRVAAITLTGSESTGSSVAAVAGQALKKLVLELGGSDPFIVLEDADLDRCVETAVRARFQNAGQSCIAAKRFIVVEQIARTFEERFVAAIRSLPVGDPLRTETRIGPMARADLREDLHDQINASAQQGALLATGGHALETPGFFYAPTVLLRVQPHMRAFREEVFGPAAAIIRVPDAATAIATANDSVYGLGGSLWTGDVDRAKQLAADIESGQVFINGMTASDPRLPFGGVKRSGYGRELSWFGIREFVNVQTVWIGPAAS
ncbi:MAG: aldehyde dehydrogenase family protein, partial [Chloroflexi bacterium]|nr:aldehyde dehydrogenase family protein [Chloroflexota bacterium]